jgi:ribosomal protein L37E
MTSPAPLAVRVADIKLLPRTKLCRRVLTSADLSSIGIDATRINEPQGSCLTSLVWHGVTYLVPRTKYPRLLSTLPPATNGLNKLSKGSLFSFYQPELLAEPPECSCDLLVKETDDFAEQRRVFSDTLWTTSPSEPLSASEWAIVPQPSMPAAPQPPPTPFPWAASVADPPSALPQEHYSSLHRLQFIPNLRKKTAAKTDKGRLQFKEKMEVLWAERKSVFAYWNGQIRQAHGNSTTPNETPLRCARCGASAFNKKIVCKDCGKSMQQYVYEELSEKEVADDSLTGQVGHVENGIKGRNTQISPKDFVAGLLLRHSDSLGFYILSDEKEWQKVVNDYRILCEGLLPRDIAEETGEPLRTVESRKERLLKAIRQFAKSNRPRPIVSDLEKAHLLRALGISVGGTEENHPDRRVKPIPRPRLPKTVRARCKKRRLRR